MEKEKIQSILESILFVGGEPMKHSKLAKIMGVEIAEIIETLETISIKYAQNESGLTLLAKGDEVQLVSNPKNSEFVEQLMKNELQDSLSNAALEVASIIAYKGPISKAEIEAIRGVNCGYTLRNLLLRGLIERNDNPKDNRGYIYNITFDFLKKLGVEDVKKLPDYDILSVDQRTATILNKE